jgi:two-component system cell cycle response regulator
MTARPQVAIDRRCDIFDEVANVCAQRMAEEMSARLHELFESLRADAELDALTGLFNRRRLERCLPQELAEAQRDGYSLTLALVDVDHFGRVNKMHGWPNGDRVLAALALRMRQSIRSTDWVARYGGEEFCIVLREASLDEACEILGRVRLAVNSEPFAIKHSTPCRVTVSIGATEIADTDDRESLLERASRQLLTAKRDGRDRICASHH